MHTQTAPLPPVVVRLPAQIDPISRERAYDQLYAAFVSGAAVVIADLSATTSCDDAALRRLVTVQRRAAAEHGELRLVIPPGSPVRRLTKVVEIDPRIRLYLSPRAAEAEEDRGHGQATHSRSPARLD